MIHVNILKKSYKDFIIHCQLSTGIYSKCKYMNKKCTSYINRTYITLKTLHCNICSYFLDMKSNYRKFILNICCKIRMYLIHVSILKKFNKDFIIHF